ncbi:hypothetical protein [Actinomyces wuliandei]|uniref:GHMP family kinase ATP-binding protein n=1 Tax=Actinomyces wuliandei TaxID=2057743 RepID=UPI0013E35BAD|nr:hypothetical protein [Actinomyces wuliandei]
MNDNEFQHFLYTLPVEELQTTASLRTVSNQRKGTSTHKQKSMTALQKLADETGVDITSMELNLSSNIPVGKGCSSSTADIIATTNAFLRRFFPGTPTPIASALTTHIASTIERGEHLTCPGIVSCAQRQHKVLQRYKTRMGITIVGVDEGGFIDTEKFHKEITPNESLACTYSDLYKRMHVALMQNDRQAVGSIATESAEIHQKVLPKESFDKALSLLFETDALGVCVAHSGTAIGMMLPSEDETIDEKVSYIQQCLLENENSAPMPVLTLLEYGV